MTTTPNDREKKLVAKVTEWAREVEAAANAEKEANRQLEIVVTANNRASTALGHALEIGPEGDAQLEAVVFGATPKLALVDWQAKTVTIVPVAQAGR